MSPWTGTGYGMQTGLFTPRIKRLGHDIAISAFYGIQGAIQYWRGIKVYPNYHAPVGTDVLVPHALNHFGVHQTRNLREVASRGLIITHYDVWTLSAPMLPNMAVAAWVPIDHEEVPPLVAKWFGDTGAVPIAQSRFGQRKLTEIGLDTLYVPAGVDTSVFHPGDQAEARERVGIPPDAFVVAMVAANIGRDGARKGFYEQILAFKALRAKHSDAVLCLHTDVDSPIGVSLRDLLGELPDHSYTYTDPYAYRLGLPASKVADIYRAADVLSNCSWGEGFGVPIIEAQACGRPVIVTDTTAMPELVGGGWLVQGEPMWHDSQRAWARRPLISSITDAYMQAYEHARDEDVQALAWAKAQEYDADLVTEQYWKPVLDQLEEGLLQVQQRLATPTVRTTPQQARPMVALAPGTKAMEIAEAAMRHGAAQVMEELAAAVELVDTMRPEVVVEVGCDQGGTLHAWRQICDRVYGITLADNSHVTGGSGDELATHGAEIVFGDSHAQETKDKLAGLLDGRPVDVLVIDGDHSVDGALADLAMYGPLVRAGGVVLMHDINSTGDPRCEVWMIWPELTQKYHTSEIGAPGAGPGWGVIHVDGQGIRAAAMATATSTADK